MSIPPLLLPLIFTDTLIACNNNKLYSCWNVEEFSGPEQSLL